MISSMTIMPTLYREQQQAREQLREIHHIRVTTDALPGSLVSVPITPERARTIRLAMFPSKAGESTVDVDPELVGRPLLEVLMHPEDYAELTKDLDAVRDVDMTGSVTRVLGIPIAP